MSAESGTNRWWENYLVRYLMPSIAGVVIVNWLCSYGGTAFRALLFLPAVGERLDTTSLTLLFLYGNLFCYVASYPVLVFHVTRSIDFTNDKWPARLIVDGYVTTILFTGIAFSLFHCSSPLHRYWLAFLAALLFVGVQLARLSLAVFPRITVRGCSSRVSPAFGYAYALARRRGIPAKTETTAPPSTIVDAGRDSASADEDEGGTEEVTTVRQIVWRRDFMDTYRHLREHGNSAFTFLSELGLTALVYCVITKPGQSAAQELGAIGMLFAVWAIPAVFVHLLGQHLERRFSQFDSRLGAHRAH
jgi:hypothetical protein